LSLGKYWQIWAILGKFYCIHSGLEHAQTLVEVLKTP
jgi:hypothetical protein